VPPGRPRSLPIKRVMIFSLVGFFIFDLAEAAPWVLMMNGIGDSLTMTAGGALVMNALLESPDQSPEEEYSSAMTLCNRARWMEHKAEQMFQMANSLDKDAKQLSNRTKDLVSNIDATTAHLQKQINVWQRMFKPQLILSVFGTVGIVVIFVLYAMAKGKGIRRSLGDIRSLEGRAEAQAAPAPAPVASPPS